MTSATANNSNPRVSLLRALNSRNYRLFFAGQGLSLIGTWMQQVAMSWLVYRLTDSAFLLGAVGFASQFPTFILAPVAGVIADWFPRRTLLLLTQSLAMVQALVLTLLVMGNLVNIWHIMVLSVVLGVVNAFDIPVRQSFVVDLVERREDLSNAIALNSSMVNAARLVGPSVAGLLIGTIGEGACFLVNTLSYLAVIAALAFIRVQSVPHHRQKRALHHELIEGAAYAFGFAPIRSILLLLALISFMGMPYAVLMPVFARDILHGGSHTYGFLMAAAGIGAMGSTIYLASKKTVLGLGKLICVAAATFGLSIAAFAFSTSLPLSLVMIAFAGFGAMAQVASSNTILQTIVDDTMRGRVMSFFTMAFMGMTPFGSLAAGSVAHQIGARYTLVIGGACCFAGALLFARHLPRLRKMVRPIYVQKGIIPEVAVGLRTAANLTIPPEEQ